jgi:hypothetical protein
VYRWMHSTHPAHPIGQEPESIASIGSLLTLDRNLQRQPLLFHLVLVSLPAAAAATDADLPLALAGTSIPRVFRSHADATGDFWTPPPPLPPPLLAPLLLPPLPPSPATLLSFSPAQSNQSRRYRRPCANCVEAGKRPVELRV